MCGIVALWQCGPADPDRIAALCRDMRDSLTDRGPDDAASWIDAPVGIALGHRRLAILDLSPQGRQPMLSAGTRYAIVFNGEVYNHRDIRRELDHAEWRGTSDTETMLAAIERWGLERAVSRFVGMFAFALWDRQDRVLHLVRDRLGIKPLAWGRADDGSLLVGSELHALRAHPRFDRSVDPSALAAFFDASCVPAPLTIHRAARKVRPGTILSFDDPRAAPRETVFWSAAEHALAGAAAPWVAHDSEILERTEAALREAVELRMLADVPLGAFLSGGIDSSLVAALAQERSGQPLRTFSIGSADAAYDETPFAAEVASILGTTHTALTISSDDALDVVPRLPAMFDEPFADSSQIPTYLVSRLARSEVTVALSGDGGDEVFGGYNRYVWAPRLARAARIPRRLRATVAAMLESFPPDRWDRARALLSPPLPRARLFGDKVHKAARALGAADLVEMHAILRRQWPLSPVGARPATDGSAVDERLRPVDELMLRDLVEYLPDDILAKVDRASMDVSLEARVPLLDHRVVELAWRLPPRAKVRHGRGKWVLRELLARRVPRRIFERAKTGFSVPVGAWLRGPLRSWADDLLQPSALRASGLDSDLVRARWNAHVAGTGDHGLALWDVLSLRAWEEGQQASRAVGRGTDEVRP